MIIFNNDSPLICLRLMLAHQEGEEFFHGFGSFPLRMEILLIRILYAILPQKEREKTPMLSTIASTNRKDKNRFIVF